MLELVLARHGETDYNAQKRLQGHSDMLLNERGLQQVGGQAEHLGKIHFDAVYSSDLLRSFQGARMHAEKYPGLSVIANRVWREKDFGSHAGAFLRDIGYPNPEYIDMVKHLYECECPGGESLNQFVDRLSSGLNRVYDDHPNQRIAIHTHGGVIIVALNYLLGEEVIFQNARPHGNGFVSYLKLEKTASGLSVVKSLVAVPASSLPDIMKDDVN